MANPWMKFYPRDWRGDQALRMVSLAARGLWMECLAVMHEATPYGHLVVNGRPVGDDALGRMVGASGDEVRSLMTELREAGVCDVTAEGVVFSRRMVRDQERAAKGRKAVKKRWSQVSGKEEKTDAPNRLPNRYPNTQKPEARGQKRRAPECAQTLGVEFKRFWGAFPSGPNKGGDVPAIQAFRRRLEAGDSAESLIAAAVAYAKAKPDTTYSTSATKFLDDGVFKGFLPASAALAPPETPGDWHRMVGYFKRRGDWCAPGPEPGQPGCQAPPEILAEFGYREKAA